MSESARHELYTKLCREMESEPFLEGDKKSIERAANLRASIERIDYDRLSPRQKMRADIAKQVGEIEGE
jgi:hypothetical protein